MKALMARIAAMRSNLARGTSASQRDELLDMLAKLVPEVETIGTPLQAIDFSLDMNDSEEAMMFLRDWRRGDLSLWMDYTAKVTAA
jgi:hypothetical protein